MSRVTPQHTPTARPAGMPAADRLSLEQARSEVVRLAMNCDYWRKQHENAAPNYKRELARLDARRREQQTDNERLAATNAALRAENARLTAQQERLRELVARVWSRDFDVADRDSQFFDKWMTDAESALAETGEPK